MKTKDLSQSAHPIPLYDFTRDYTCLDRSKGQKQGQANLVTSYNNVWQSGNCDVCVNILYWRILIWTSTFTITATAYIGYEAGAGYHRAVKGRKRLGMDGENK